LFTSAVIFGLLFVDIGEQPQDLGNIPLKADVIRKAY